MNAARNIQPIKSSDMTTFLQQVMNFAQDTQTKWILELKPGPSSECPDQRVALFKAAAPSSECPDQRVALFKAAAPCFSILLVTSITSREGFCEAAITADDFCGSPAVIKIPDELAVQLRTHVLALMKQSN